MILRYFNRNTIQKPFIYIYIKVFSTRWEELREIHRLPGIITIIQIGVDYNITIKD